MKSQFQFFMLENEEVEFVNFSLGLCDAIDQSSKSQWFFKVGDCQIQFLRPQKFENELISGRIAIQTTGYGFSFKAAESAENVYKKMRAWLKKRYSNKMTCKNINIEDSQMKLKYFWYSPGVERLVKENPMYSLKQIKGAPVVFEIENEA